MQWTERIEVSTFAYAKMNMPTPKPLKLSALIGQIADNRIDRGAPARLASLVDPVARREFKAGMLPCYTPAGIMKPKRHSDNLAVDSKLYALDFDQCTESEVAELLAAFRRIDQTLFAYRSISGKGVHALFFLPQEDNREVVTKKLLHWCSVYFPSIPHKKVGEGRYLDVAVTNNKAALLFFGLGEGRVVKQCNSSVLDNVTIELETKPTNQAEPTVANDKLKQWARDVVIGGQLKLTPEGRKPWLRELLMLAGSGLFSETEVIELCTEGCKDENKKQVALAFKDTKEKEKKIDGVLKLLSEKGIYYKQQDRPKEPVKPTRKTVGNVVRLEGLPREKPKQLERFVPPRGFVSIISGDSGSGKSLYAYNDIAKLTRNGCKAIIINDDQDKADVYALCIKVKVCADNVRYIDFENTTPQQFKSDLDATIADLCKVDVILIDTIFSFCSMLWPQYAGSQERDLVEIDRRHADMAMKMLKQLATQHNCAIVTLVHSVKHTETRLSIPGHPKWMGLAHAAYVVVDQDGLRGLSKLEQVTLAQQPPMTRYVIEKKNRSCTEGNMGRWFLNWDHDEGTLDATDARVIMRSERDEKLATEKKIKIEVGECERIFDEVAHRQADPYAKRKDYAIAKYLAMDWNKFQRYVAHMIAEGQLDRDSDGRLVTAAPILDAGSTE